MRHLWPLLALAACGGPSQNPDAGEDAGVEAPPTFCFSRPKLEFCEDFDGAALPGNFATLTQKHGEARLVAGDSTTEPKAAEFHTTGDGADVWLSMTTPTTSLHTFKTFVQLKVDEWPDAGVVEVLSLSTGDAHYGLRISASGEYSVAADDQVLATQTLDAGAWQAVRLDVLHDGGTRLLTFRLGSDALLERTAVTPAASWSEPVFAIGTGADAGAGWRVKFDTITFIHD